jgi:pimeloyl-ACP methyl ester carboxylesterase
MARPPPRRGRGSWPGSGSLAGGGAGLRAKATFTTREATSHLTNCLKAACDADEAVAGSRPEFRRARAEALIALGDLASLAEDLATAEGHHRAAIEAAPDADLRRRIENKRHHPGTAKREGTRIAFHEHGSGDTTLLFVSTQAIGLATFQPILERLCDEFKIVAVDPRGSGGSDPLVRPYPLGEHAADVRAVIAGLGTLRLIGVGISIGANLLFRIAHAAPGLLRGIVTVGGPIAGHRRPFFPDDWLQLQQETARTLEVEPMLRLHVSHVFSEPDMREMLDAIVRTRLTLPRETLLSFFLDDWEDDVTSLLPAIATPTLVTHGREDRLVSFAAAELMASSLPDARLHGFEGKGHLPLFTAT